MRRDLTNITGYIYKITAPSGAVYIGQTINTRKRKSDYNCGSFKKQTQLWNNCQKYNWNPSNYTKDVVVFFDGIYKRGFYRNWLFKC